MRLARGALLPPVPRTRPKRRDIYQVLRNAILDGVLRPGDRLPSTRHAAADYRVSRGLLEEVFAQLVEEGFLTRSVGRGTFVSESAARFTRAAATLPKGQASKLSTRGLELSANAACREPRVLRPFNAGVADASEFPLPLWQRLTARAARQLGREAFCFADPAGLPQLQSAIARYLAQFRGIQCLPEQVVIFNSSQQALNALCILLLDRGDFVWIEDPCYLGARAAFRIASAKAVPVPVDAHGIRVDIGIDRCRAARLAYVTPSHQYPTGAVMSMDRRLELLHWAAARGSWILEDDYDGEFRYSGQPLIALHSLASNSRVLYVGSLNKSMFVALRLAYAVVPSALVRPLTNLRTQLDGFTAALLQMTMSLFIEEGFFSTHLRRMRSLYGAKYRELIQGISGLQELGWTWENHAAGLHLLIQHRNGDYVRSVARTSALKLALLSSYRAARSPTEGFLLRFGGLSLKEIREGCRTLVSSARSAG